MRRVSRRKFLRSAARAGIGAGGLALVGCSSPPTYNERRDAEMQPTGVPQAGQVLASEPTPEEQAEAVAQSVEAREADEADEEQLNPALRGDPETLRRQRDWRRLRDASGRDGIPRRGGRITLNEPGPWYWSPITPAGMPPAASVGGVNLLPLLYSQLITLRVDDQTDAHRNTIEGDLASQWEIADETTIVFHLRPGVAWPEQAPLEGRELTASDVRHGQERYLDGNAHQRAAYRTVDRIEADDAGRSVSFHLTLPTAYLLNAMTAPDHIILPPEADIDELSEGWTPGSMSLPSSAPPVPGTGPFDHWSSGGPGSPWSMRRKPSYFKRDAAPGSLPYVDEIHGNIPPGGPAALSDPSRTFDAIMAAWRSGRLDALVLQSRDELGTALDQRSDAVFQFTPPMPWRGSAIRTIEGGRNSIKDRRIMRALSMAVDRERLADRWHGGFASPDCGMHWPATVDPATGGYREWPWPIAELGNPYQHDPAAAHTLLAASGYDSENPLPLVFDTGIPAQETPDLGEDPEADRRSLVTAQWQSAFGDAVRIEARAAIVTVGDNLIASYAPDGDANLSMQKQLGGFAFPSDPDPTTINLRPAPPDGSEADDVQYGVEDDEELRNLWELQARELDPAERSDILERIRARRAEHMQPIHLVNVWGIFVRRDDVFNLSATYFAHHPLGYSKQLEHTWTLADS